MILRPNWVGELPPAELLASCVAEHAAGLARVRMLRDYYDGRHAISSRVRASGLPNARLTHAFPRYICRMTSGYLIGGPIAYDAPGQEAVMARLKRQLDDCAIDSVDAELARDAAIYGKALELIYCPPGEGPRSVAVSPEEAFVVYESVAGFPPLLGVRMTPVIALGGDWDTWRCDVYTRDTHFTYEMREFSAAGFAEPVARRAHFFGGVPLIEFWNAEDEKGDFEAAISLIDAYDALQSDRVNDKQQFVDALLVFYGCTLETDADGRTPGRQLREDKAIALPDSDARAEWLCKRLDEADTEVLKRALNADIHKMCMTPDMTDENFAGNTSGVAMRYKLLGLEQLTRVKERWFSEALRERLRLYSNLLALRGAGRLDPAGVRFVFTRSLPVNELETAQTISQLRGLVSDERLSEKAGAAIGV